MQLDQQIRIINPIFNSLEDFIPPNSPRQLQIETISFPKAIELNALWHSTLPRMGTGFIKNQPFPCFAATFDGFIYAVAIWSNPVARNLPQKTWMELRRLAHAPDAPRNIGSWMLSGMSKLLKQQRPWLEKLVSYSVIGVHQGTIYKAAGWTPTTINRSGNWNRKNRPRPEAQNKNPKQRWEKDI